MGEGPSRHLREWVPRWWRGEGGPIGTVLDALLWPAEVVFRAGVAMRNRTYEAGLLRVEEPAIPVISVGNLAVGGAGKTPFSAWVAARLQGWGHRPAMVLRGYGEDEILVHHELNPGVPVFAAARRADGVREAASAGSDVAVLDDAFQHRRLARDLDLVLVAADGWGENFLLLPRGPWREGIEGVRRADLVIVTRKAAPEAAVREVEDALAARIGRDRIVRCSITPTRLLRVAAGSGIREVGPPSVLADRGVLAVTSLADPRSFVRHLTAEGVGVELAAFPDHHEFTADEAAGLARRAGNRPLVMTRKEAVKLERMLPQGTEAWMLDQEVRIERGADALDQALQKAVRR